MGNQQPSITFPSKEKVIKIYKRLSELDGYENCGEYLIYDDGRIYSEKTRKFLKCSKDTKGYKYLSLKHLKAKRSCPKVHRLVISLFLGEKPEMQVNHIDGNKENNSIENLEYVTNKENRIHAIENGLKDEVNYGVAMCDLSGNVIKVFNTCTEALLFLNKPNASPGNIGRVIRGKRATAYGYKWKSYEGSTTIP